MVGTTRRAMARAPVRFHHRKEFSMFCVKRTAAACAMVAAATVAPAQFTGFAPCVDVPVGVGYDPTGVVLADFDNDGDLDIACAVFTAATLDRVVILLNNGDGSFGLPDTYGVGDSPIDIAAGDFNLDGKIDLVTANRDTDDFSLLRGNGDGTFQAEVWFFMGDRPHGIAVADFNDDGLPDVAVCNELDDTVGVRFGDGAGGFGVPNFWGTNNPDGIWGNGPRGIAAADLNFDGLPDIVTANTDSDRGTILYNIAGSPGNFFYGEFGRFVTTGDGPLDVTAEDLGHDGDVDLVFSNGFAGTITVRFNEYFEQGGVAFPAFPSSATYSVGGRPVGVCTADFDDTESDGDPDLVVADELNSRLRVLINNGNAVFSSAGVFAAASSPQRPVSGDLDGDGDIDIVTPQYNAGSVGVFINLTTVIGGPAPTVRIISPGDAGTAAGCVCGTPVVVTGVADVPGGIFDRLRLEYRSSTGSAWTLITEDEIAVPDPGGVVGSWSTAGLAEGLYLLRLTAWSASGLSSTDETLVFVSKNYNTLNFTVAGGFTTTGSVISASVIGSRACIDGFANDDWCTPNTYTVDYSPTGAAPWFPVDPTTPVYSGDRLNESLAVWSTGGVVDGNYTLRVVGENDCGEQRSATRTVKVDNTNPVATIQTPVNCDHFDPEGVIQIRGTASDANLSAWSLYYTGGTSTTWEFIASGTGNVVNGVLANWNTAGLPPCVYTLRLRVADTAVVNCDTGGHVVDRHATLAIGCRADLAEPYNLLDLADINAFVSSFLAGCP